MGLLDWLFTDPNQPGGSTQLGNWLGITSPTASTQTPIMASYAASTPTLGGSLPQNTGLLSGLLGGQQPANSMSYFQPQPGLLGDSPLGNILRGAFSGLGAAAGHGGLTGMGLAAMGGEQAT